MLNWLYSLRNLPTLLGAFLLQSAALQHCLRNLWSDHLLFKQMALNCWFLSYPQHLHSNRYRYDYFQQNTWYWIYSSVLVLTSSVKLYWCFSIILTISFWQLLYETCLCIWLLSYYEPAIEYLATSRTLPRLIDVVKCSTKEKVCGLFCTSFLSVFFFF